MVVISTEKSSATKKRSIKRPLAIALLVSLGLPIAAVNRQIRESKNEGKNAKPQIMAGEAAYGQHARLSSYPQFSEADRTQTVSQALANLPVDMSDWKKSDTIEFCELGNRGPANHKPSPADLWLTKQINDAAKQMGIYDKTKPFIGMFAPCKYFNAAYIADKNSKLVIVNHAFLDQVTVEYLKLVLTHELRHERQNNVPGMEAAPYWREHDADLAVAKIYGPDAAIQMLDMTQKIFAYQRQHIEPETHTRFVRVLESGKPFSVGFDATADYLFKTDDIHGSFAERKDVIREAYPDNFQQPVQKPDTLKVAWQPKPLTSR